MELTIVLTWGAIYLSIGLLMVLINCFMAGWSMNKSELSDFKDLVMWPFSLAETLGLLARVLTQKIANELTRSPKKSKEETHPNKRK